jgi:hypothetical protein
MPKLHRPAVRLPKGWKNRARLAVLQVISLAQYSLAVAHGQTTRRPGCRNVDGQRLEQEVLHLPEVLRIKDARMADLPLHRRPHYPPVERMADGPQDPSLGIGL